jgi:hypothetical protein
VGVVFNSFSVTDVCETDFINSLRAVNTDVLYRNHDVCIIFRWSLGSCQVRGDITDCSVYEDFCNGNV